MNTASFTAIDNAPVNFYFDHLNKQIVGTRKAFDLSGNPNTPFYKELMERMEQQPTYTFRVIERKKNDNKRTYAGLTYNLMIDYLDALADNAGMNEPEKSKEIQDFRESMVKMKTDGVAFGKRKKTFLERYPDFSVNKAKELIKAHDFHALKVNYKIIRMGKPETGSHTITYSKASGQ